MRYPSPSSFRESAQFRDALRNLGVDMDLDDVLRGDDGPLASDYLLGERRLGNRMCVNPMEGWDGTTDGLPSEHNIRRWRRFGQSGAKLIWGGEAFAVVPDGRANPRQLCLMEEEDSQRGLTRLIAALREEHESRFGSIEDLVVGLQLTHSGRFAHPTGEGPVPRTAYRHPLLDERFGADKESALLTDEELDSIGHAFVRAAGVAQRAGFDFVDVKCCHGYLLHELLSARTRPGRFGGSLENRASLVLGIVRRIRQEYPDLMVGVRLSVTDTVPHSKKDGVGSPDLDSGERYETAFGVDMDDPERSDYDEPFRLLEMLQDAGVTLVNVTIGSPYYSPHIQRPAAYPPSDGYPSPSDPLISVARHLAATRACKKRFPDLCLVGSGYSYLQEWFPHVGQYELSRESVDFVGLGRLMLSYPDVVKDILTGASLDRKRVCRTFSDCTTAPRNGMISGCYPLDSHYRAMPEADEVRKLRPERP